MRIGDKEQKEKAPEKVPTIYRADLDGSGVTVRLMVKDGEQKEYHIALYGGSTTTITIVAVAILLAAIVIGVIISILKVGNNIDVLKGFRGVYGNYHSIRIRSSPLIFDIGGK